MRLHFVCTGNIFRSRLAQSLTSSLRPDIDISSSGIMASTNEWGTIGWFTKQVLQENNLLQFDPGTWTQTDPSILSSQDLVVFMEPFHLKYCQQYFSFKSNNYQVWNVEDINHSMSDQQLLDHCRTTFGLLKPQIEKLLSEL